jgi:two-component system, chemotaxis family, response regulator Rcp1
MSAIQVLLVEDNPLEVDLMREALVGTKFDIELSVVNDGVEAIEFLRSARGQPESKRPALIMLDLNMPRSDGRQLLTVLKSRDILRSIPTVVFSGSTYEDDIADCYHLGASCYVVKPHNIDDYCAVVNTLFDFWFGESGAYRYIKRPCESYVPAPWTKNGAELRPSPEHQATAAEFGANESGDWFRLTSSERDTLILMRLMGTAANP